MSIKKTTEQFAAEILDKHNLVLLSEYQGAHSTVQFTCSNGHENSAVATNLLRRGYVCKQCKHGRRVIPKIHWGEESISKLKQLAVANTNLDEIAEIFSTTASAIVNACDKFEISRKQPDTSYARLIDIISSQDRQLLTTQQDYQGINTYIESRCKNNHTISQLASNVLYKNTGCPKCAFIDGKSKSEASLVGFIREHYSGWLELGDRTILVGKELDIVIPDLGLAFEYNGEYWHSDTHVSKTYHLDKTIEVENFGYRLIHVPEHQWVSRTEQWKSYILNLLGKTNTKIFARKTKLVKLDYWPGKWLEQNHLQGAGAPTSVNYALMYGEQIVAVMTFSKPRFNKQYEWELVRYCTKLNTNVPGGASKLLKGFEQDYLPDSLISYANRLWSQGGVYSKLGFTHTHNSDPGYYYSKKLRVVSRYKAQKHQLETWLPGYDPKLSEYDNMRTAGYSRVWDCGNQVWIKSYPLRAGK